MPTSQALRMAEEADLDLVVISPNQAPPVAKILNYGKYKYELEKKAKEAKKKQHVVDVKEIKVRYKIDTHDYEVRLKNIRKFISQGNKVKIVARDIQGSEMELGNGTSFNVYFNRATGALYDEANNYCEMRISQGKTTYVVAIEPTTGKISNERE